MIGTSPGSEVSPAAGRRPIVVLLVDDQPFTGSVLRLLLESETDIDLRCCLLAVNAIAVANEIAPTLVLQDLIMPEIDGFTLVRSFRTNPQTAGTPIIVLSGNEDAATRARAFAEGADGFLVKLPPKTELIACIREHASQSAGGRNTLDLAVIDGFRNAGAPAFAIRLIDQFILEAQSRVLAIRQEAGRADPPALSAIAHSLKGSAMMMGAMRLGALCGRVEDRAALTPPLAAPAALIAEIETELARVQAALTAQKERFAS